MGAPMTDWTHRTTLSTDWLQVAGYVLYGYPIVTVQAEEPVSVPIPTPIPIEEEQRHESARPSE
jgi:hypothetical protein